MRRMLLMALLLALLSLCACAGPEDAAPPVAMEPQSQLVPLADGPESAQDLIFLVDEEMDEVFFRAAEQFSQRLAGLSDNTLQISVRRAKGAGAIFAAGTAPLAFLDSSRDNGRCDYFSAVRMPFLYSGYQNFTMTVNDSQILSMLGEDMRRRFGAYPLAGYYQPGTQLLTTWQATSTEPFDGKAVATDPTTGSGQGFFMLGSRVLGADTAGERLELLRSGEAQGAELTLPEMADVPLPEGDYYLNMTYHSLSPVWLTVKEQFMDSLTPRQRAAVTEACAYLFHHIDQVYLQQEADCIERLRGNILLNPYDFTDVQDTVLEYLTLQKDSPIGRPEGWLLELAQERR